MQWQSDSAETDSHLKNRLREVATIQDMIAHDGIFNAQRAGQEQNPTGP